MMPPPSVSDSIKKQTNPTIGKSGRSGLFSFTCGCKGSKSVSVVAFTPPLSNSSLSTGAAATMSGDTHHKSRTSTSKSNQHEQRLSMDSVGSFSTLLRDLGDLERSVVGLDTHRAVRRNMALSDNGDVEDLDRRPSQEEEEAPSPTDRRLRCKGRRDDAVKSVAVVSETNDPLGDFRKSMLTMIVANDIDSEDELWDLVIQFLNLNSPQNHALILRAFADVCSEFFLPHHRRR